MAARLISLLCKLQQLHKRVDQNPNDIPSVAELQRTKTELQRLAEHKTKGAIIRSKARWYELGEKNNKYFFNLEKRSFNRKHTEKLKTEQASIEEPQEIFLEMENFYSTLYTSKIPAEKDCNETSADFFSKVKNLPRLSKEQQDLCEGLITAEECWSVIQSLAKNKSPGTDGLTAEFYLRFWDDIKLPFLDCLNECFENGELSISQRRGVISLLPKKNKDPLYLKNWRPISAISLLNTDYKIATKCIAKRLEKVLLELINRDQTGDGAFGAGPPPVFLRSLVKPANSFFAEEWRFFHFSLTSFKVRFSVPTAFTAAAILLQSSFFSHLVSYTVCQLAL